MMKRIVRWNTYRFAATVLILYCILHSYGALLTTPQFGADSDSVIAAMRSVHFPAQGFRDTWYGFYEGFGWFASVLFALSAAQLWIIGGWDDARRRSARSLVLALALAHAVGAALCLEYFFTAALFFSTLTTIAILWALWRDRQAISGSERAGGRNGSLS